MAPVFEKPPLLIIITVPCHSYCRKQPDGTGLAKAIVRRLLCFRYGDL
jgi:hypothetical protein